MALILASLGLTAGYLKPNDFVAIIMVILTTVLLTPILLRLVFMPPAFLREMLAKHEIAEGKPASEG